MIEVVDREDITIPYYKRIMDAETHHDHKILRSNDDRRMYWEPNEAVCNIVDKIGLNDVIILLMNLGYDKNSEVYRKLYRDIGYTLEGYWEIFYWEVNNPDGDDYSSSLL